MSGAIAVGRRARQRQHSRHRGDRRCRVALHGGRAAREWCRGEVAREQRGRRGGPGGGRRAGARPIAGHACAVARQTAIDNGARLLACSGRVSPTHVTVAEVTVAMGEARARARAEVDAADVVQPSRPTANRWAVTRSICRSDVAAPSSRAPAGRPSTAPGARVPSRPSSAIAPRLSRYSFQLPHFGDCTHDGQPSSQEHAAMRSSVAPRVAGRGLERELGDPGAAGVAVVDEDRRLRRSAGAAPSRRRRRPSGRRS